jgi:hypothetical protein
VCWRRTAARRAGPGDPADDVDDEAEAVHAVEHQQPHQGDHVDDPDLRILQVSAQQVGGGEDLEGGTSPAAARTARESLVSLRACSQMPRPRALITETG